MGFVESEIKLCIRHVMREFRRQENREMIEVEVRDENVSFSCSNKSQQKRDKNCLNCSINI